MNRNIRKNNYANQFTIILFVAIIVNLVCYALPDSILGISIKKVDLLSDIRKPSQNNTQSSSLFADIEVEDEIYPTDSLLNPNDANLTTLNAETTIPSRSPNNTQRNTDSSDNRTTDNTGSNNADNAVNPENRTADNTGARRTGNFNPNNKLIEDFSSGHTGLSRFFYALNNIDNLGRPVRIAFVGDSFIEGDILVADFRAKMQAQFGGRGVGFIPVTSVTEQYRPTIKQSSDGWKTYSIIKDKNRKYVLSGVQFEPSAQNASIRFQTVDMYPGLEEVSSLKFIYSKNEDTDLVLNIDDETMSFKLQPTETVTQFELTGHFRKGLLQFKNAQGLKAIGIALEDNYGVIVDNFSLRGNSGIIMSELDSESCRNLQQIRPYDLIVLQYGLNVANEDVQEYGWYRNRMVPVIEHIQNCFPGADILILSVSDRSRNGQSTMPAVVSLLRAQRQMAESAEVAFWSIFAAMGGENSMIRYVDSNWASKDYTHLSFRGGREIAHALFDALITEKNLYADNENQTD